MTIWYPQYGSLWTTQISSKKIEKKGKFVKYRKYQSIRRKRVRMKHQRDSNGPVL